MYVNIQTFHKISDSMAKEGEGSSIEILRESPTRYEKGRSKAVELLWGLRPLIIPERQLPSGSGSDTKGEQKSKYRNGCLLRHVTNEQQRVIK